jgi:hypothetical protein
MAACEASVGGVNVTKVGGKFVQAMAGNRWVRGFRV